MAKDKHYYPVPLIAQANSKCCWFACYQMIYGWKKGRRASDVAPKLAKAGISTNDALDISQWGRCASHLGMKGMRVSYIKGKANFDNMVDVLDRWGPMWCAGDFLNGSPHAILISGWSRSSKTLRFIDPYELWRGNTHSDYGHTYWSALIKNSKFACQQVA